MNEGERIEEFNDEERDSRRGQVTGGKRKR
jgi:hypothetical protein